MKYHRINKQMRRITPRNDECSEEKSNKRTETGLEFETTLECSHVPFSALGGRAYLAILTVLMPGTAPGLWEATSPTYTWSQKTSICSKEGGRRYLGHHPEGGVGQSLLRSTFLLELHRI